MQHMKIHSWLRIIDCPLLLVTTSISVIVGCLNQLVCLVLQAGGLSSTPILAALSTVLLKCLRLIFLIAVCHEQHRPRIQYRTSDHTNKRELAQSAVLVQWVEHNTLVRAVLRVRPAGSIDCRLLAFYEWSLTIDYGLVAIDNFSVTVDQ